MRGRRTNCLLAALLMTMTLTHHAPGVRASLILRGRWTASIDEMDTVSSGTVHGDGEHLRGVVRLLRDHQRRRPDLSIERFPNLRSEIVNRLLQPFEHQVKTCWLRIFASGIFTLKMPMKNIFSNNGGSQRGSRSKTCSCKRFFYFMSVRPRRKSAINIANKYK